MSDHDALLRAICENPRDDLPRLVYADWLDENADAFPTPAVAREKARFIRTEVDVYRRPEWDGERARYEHTARLDPKGMTGKPWYRDYPVGVPSGADWSGGPELRRGFPWCLRVVYPDAVLTNRGSTLFDRQPVERLAFASNPPDLRTLLAGPWLPRLTGLEFHRSRFAARHLGPFLGDPRAAHLEELHFWSNGVSADGLAAVLDSPVFPNLTALTLAEHDRRVGQVLLDRLADGPAPPRLRQLKVRRSLPGDYGVVMLVAGLPAGVELLDLSGGGLTGGGGGIFDHPGWQPVRVLSLASNPLGNFGAHFLAVSPSLPNLHVLDLSYCQVGDDGCRAILDSPLADQLTFLDLTGSPASAEMKGAVRERMGERVRL